MARTLDPEAHAIRRDAFVDAAERLILTKGYERISIQDVLDAVGASKGAFYHYFDSKAALLDGVVARMVEGATAAVGPLLADPDRSAVDKLNGLLSGIAGWKLERREYLLQVMRGWYSDDNALVRERFRRRVIARLAPLYATIVRQAMLEGSFSATSADHVARVLVGLQMSASDHVGDLLLAWQAGQLPFELVEEALSAYWEAYERILGAPPGSVWRPDSETLREWFEQATELDERSEPDDDRPAA